MKGPLFCGSIGEGREEGREEGKCLVISSCGIGRKLRLFARLTWKMPKSGHEVLLPPQATSCDCSTGDPPCWCACDPLTRRACHEIFSMVNFWCHVLLAFASLTGVYVTGGSIPGLECHGTAVALGAGVATLHLRPCLATKAQLCVSWSRSRHTRGLGCLWPSLLLVLPL